jgi:hypothetical protein
LFCLALAAAAGADGASRPDSSTSASPSSSPNDAVLVAISAGKSAVTNTKMSLQPWGVAVLTVGAFCAALGLSLLLLGVLRIAEKPAKGIDFVEAKHVASDANSSANPGLIWAVVGGIVLCSGIVMVGVGAGLPQTAGIP